MCKSGLLFFLISKLYNHFFPHNRLTNKFNWQLFFLPEAYNVQSKDRNLTDANNIQQLEAMQRRIPMKTNVIRWRAEPNATMAAACSSCESCGSATDLMSKAKSMRLKSLWTFILLILTVRMSLAEEEDDHEMEEFLKREFSLSKPYQGIHQLGHRGSGLWDRCF